MRFGGTRFAAALGALVVIAGLVAAVAWYGTGGRGQIVATPSMGTAAPVGTLVLTRPAAGVGIGDVVTYRPPVANHPLTVTHRVVAVAPDGSFRTRGDINGAEDPWTVRPADLVGRAVFVGPGLGWLVKALPLLVSGVLLLWWVTRLWVPRRWGVPLRVLGFSGLIAAATTVLRPFVGVVTLATTTDGAGSHVTLVSTGLLPIRVTAATGGHLDLVDGQVGVLTTQVPQGEKGTVITSGVHMPVWLWVVMVAFWLTPMLYGLVAAWRHPLVDETGAAGPDEPPTAPLLLPVTAPIERYRAPLVGTSVVAGLVVALTLVIASTTASFTARVTNSANTAASAPYFTCAAASTDGSADFQVWPLDDAPVTNGSTARDLSDSRTRTGTYTGGFTTTGTKPCPRDTPARAVTLAPTAQVPSYVTPTAALSTPARNTFSIAVWFRTTTTTGGRLLGFSPARTGASLATDRHLYMTDTGRIVFGVQPTLSAPVTVSGARAYNDGVWHLAVATLSPAGMTLSVDGAQVAANQGVTSGSLQLLGGYWRAGWDTLAGWPSRPATDYWTGSLAYASVYTDALSTARIAALYTAGT
ncbi:LamG-like jellyroll fold domain-containing protein [Actinomycetospora atypica]|uniref:LamG-like jellyroll fold domain-containing protein n=1 Tax=Actinomycetospora atypica TaxID=1290095 RepID=A0ABV9YV49_9PSEU